MSDPVQRTTAARRVGDIAQPGDTTVGVAVSAAVATTVRGGGIEVSAVARGSAAVAVVALEQRGERWWGRLARGVAGRAASTWRASVREPVVFSTSLRTVEFEFRNPLPVASAFSTGTYGGSIQIEGGAPDAGFELEARVARVEAGAAVRGTVQGWGQRRPQDGPPVYTWFNDWLALEPDPGPPIDWRPAARALVPVSTGLGWWGAIEAAARSGQWVRRASWASGRRVRFESGLGTSPAVARQDLAGTLTTVDVASFGPGEFLAEDWLFDGTEAPLVDVSDVAFEGPVVFAVSRPQVEPPAGDPSGDDEGGAGVTFPTGEGVPYVRGGKVVGLLPVKDGLGNVWRP